MKILRLESSNVKRLVAVEIVPQGNTVIIGGQNGQGKSSILDSIAYALGGKDMVCHQPVRTGTDGARVVCNLGDMIVTRTFASDGGSTLTVTNADGTAKYRTPQRILDGLVGKLTFDPLEFSRQAPKQQMEILRAMVGIDFTGVNAERDNLYASRTQMNRDIKALEGKLAAIPQVDAPDNEVSVSEVADTLQKALEHNAGIRRLADTINSKKEQLESVEKSIAHAREQIRKWENAIVTCQGEIERTSQSLAEIEAEYASITPIDTEAIRQQIGQVEKTNANVRSNKARANTESILSVTRKEAQELSEAIEEIDAQKATTLREAKFPVAGLSIGEDGVTFNGLPFSQCSSAEQLRISVAMGLAMNPKLKVLLIRDGSLLDAGSLQMVADMAQAADAQVWIERVGEGAECQVIIEDGAVKEVVTSGEGA